jgi:glycine cleavage system H protein
VTQPSGLLFSKEHEWARFEGDVAVVGISAYAQESLGDVVYVELPRVGSRPNQFANAGVIESVKAVSDLFTPIGGEIIEVNGSLEDDPAKVNRDPFGEGWLFKVKMADPGQRDNLLSGEQYDAYLAEQS